MVPTPAQKPSSGCIIRIFTTKGKPMKMMTKGQKKVGKVMGEYKAGKLHSGGTGKIVKNPKQAIAIAMSEAKMPMRGQRTAKNKAKK